MLHLKKISHEQLLKRHILDESLGDWKFFLPIPEESKVLSLGFYSMGRVLSLSRICAQLFVVSELPQMANFCETPRIQKSQSNVYFVYGTIESHLPFIEKSLDLIDIDWNGFFSTHNLQKRRRINYLERLFYETYRILKPGGKIYFSSCSSLMAKIFQKRQLHFWGSLDFWIRKLEWAGFRKFEKYLLYPDPYYFRVIFPLDYQKDLRSYLKLIPDMFWGKNKFFKRYFLDKILGNKNLNYFLPGFGIVASK
jgi:SAM-dependent methyltransferase